MPGLARASSASHLLPLPFKTEVRGGSRVSVPEWLQIYGFLGHLSESWDLICEQLQLQPRERGGKAPERGLAPAQVDVDSLPSTRQAPAAPAKCSALLPREQCS